MAFLRPDLVQAAHATLGCVVAGLSTPAARAFVAPGEQVAWDDCCGGQVWVRVVQANPVESLQARKASGEMCGPDAWRITMEAGALRCAHVVDDEGNAPTAAELTADADQVLVDMDDVLRAVTCCVKPETIIGWTPLGPEGGCVGGVWAFTFRLTVCDCEG